MQRELQKSRFRIYFMEVANENKSQMRTKVKWKKHICLAFSLAMLLATTAGALSSDTVSFSKTGDEDCDFGPDTGSVVAFFYSNSGYLCTQVSFQYSESDETAIAEYNDKLIPKYAGIGITNDPTGGVETMDAYYILTNVTDPYTDVESDIDSQNSYREESEVVACGPIYAGQSHYMQTYWYDHRDGSAAGAGRWCVNAELSYKLGSEYLVKEWASVAELSYGSTYGEP